MEKVPAEERPAVIARLLRSEEERRRLGETGGKFFEAHYTPKAVDEQFRLFVEGISKLASQCRQ